MIRQSPGAAATKTGTASGLKAYGRSSGRHVWEKPPDISPLIQAIRLYLNSYDPEVAYVARVILFRFGTAEGALDMLSHCDLPSMEDDIVFRVRGAHLPNSLALNSEIQKRREKLLSDAAVQKQLSDLAKTGGPAYEKLATGLLSRRDKVLPPVFDAPYIDNPHLTDERLQAWLDTYKTRPLSVPDSAFLIFQRTKSDNIHKTVVNWLRAEQPTGSDRFVYQVKLKEHLDKVMKDPALSLEAPLLAVSLANDAFQLQQLSKHPDPKIRHAVL